MKTLTAILAGYIAGTTGLTAQNIQTAPSARGAGHPPKTEAPQMISGPYTRWLIIEEGPAAAGSGTDRMTMADDAAAHSGYQVIVLPPDYTGPTSADDRTFRTPAAAGTPSIFDGLTDDDFTYLSYGGQVDATRTRGRSSGISKSIQVLTIEPLNMARRLPPDAAALRKQAMIRRRPESAGLEWLPPRTALDTWTGGWINETKEIPLVIVKYEF
jgi:hypothetical protein